MRSLAPGTRAVRSSARSAAAHPTHPRRSALYPRAGVLGAGLLAGVLWFSGAAGQTSGEPALSGSYTAGPLLLAFDTLGVYRVSLKGAVGVEGAYEIHGDTVVLYDRDGPLACPAVMSGRYAWKRSGATLRLRVISDGCSERQDVLATEWAAVEAGARDSSVSRSSKERPRLPAIPPSDHPALL